MRILSFLLQIQKAIMSLMILILHEKAIDYLLTLLYVMY